MWPDRLGATAAADIFSLLLEAADDAVLDPLDRQVTLASEAFLQPR
jgi:hypothetical protein